MAEGTDVIRRVDKAVASVNKGADKKEEMMMMVAPYANWGEYLVPAPLSIALLGELILISGNTDFSLEKKPPKDGFQVQPASPACRLGFRRSTGSGLRPLEKERRLAFSSQRLVTEPNRLDADSGNSQSSHSRRPQRKSQLVSKRTSETRQLYSSA